MSQKAVRLGGMALANGVLVHGPRHWACAVRTGEGELKVASGEKRLKAVDAGSLKRAHELEALGFLQLTLAAADKTAWTSGFALAD